MYVCMYGGGGGCMYVYMYEYSPRKKMKMKLHFSHVLPLTCHPMVPPSGVPVIYTEPE